MNMKNYIGVLQGSKIDFRVRPCLLWIHHVPNAQAAFCQARRILTSTLRVLILKHRQSGEVSVGNGPGRGNSAWSRSARTWEGRTEYVFIPDTPDVSRCSPAIDPTTGESGVEDDRPSLEGLDIRGSPRRTHLFSPGPTGSTIR